MKYNLFKPADSDITTDSLTQTLQLTDSDITTDSADITTDSFGHYN